jgi:hypothetical protein
MSIDSVTIAHDRRAATASKLLATPRVLSRITKRDGMVVTFDASKIQFAIAKAGRSTREFDDLHLVAIWM